MLYCPFRSPRIASKLFDGGLRTSFRMVAAWSLVRALVAASAKPSNSFTRSPARNRSVLRSLHPLIAMLHRYMVYNGYHTRAFVAVLATASCPSSWRSFDIG